MHFDEREVGEFRIYAGALDAPRGDGYIAAMVVHQVRGVANAPREIFRDESVSCGHRWDSPDAALAHAMGKASEMLRHRAVAG